MDLVSVLGEDGDAARRALTIRAAGKQIQASFNAIEQVQVTAV